MHDFQLLVTTVVDSASGERRAELTVVHFYERATADFAWNEINRDGNSMMGVKQRATKLYPPA